MSDVSKIKFQDSTVFLINFVINGYVPKRTPNEIRDLIVLFTYAKNSSRFEKSIAGWQMQINISLTESKINKFVNAQMLKNDIPVYLPCVVERKWSVQQLKQEILKMYGIWGEEYRYTLWMRRKCPHRWRGKRYTWMFAPDVDDNMKMKKLYKTGFKAYIPVIVNKKWKTVGRKLNAGEEYILSKSKPKHREQENFYGLGNYNRDYTKAELFKLWGGKDLTKWDPAWKKQIRYYPYPTWDPPYCWPSKYNRYGRVAKYYQIVRYT